MSVNLEIFCIIENSNLYYNYIFIYVSAQLLKKQYTIEQIEMKQIWDAERDILSNINCDIQLFICNRYNQIAFDAYHKQQQ